MLDKPIAKAQVIAVPRSFVPQYRRSAKKVARNSSSELRKAFGIRALGSMIVREKDSYTFSSFDTFGECTAEGAKASKKGKSVQR